MSDLPFLSKENLLLGYSNALKTRKNKLEAVLFQKNEEENLLKIFNDLINRTYKHGPYKKLIINDSKKRYIHSPNFRDHIFHHMLHNVIYPILNKRIAYQSFATRKGKGVHKALEYFLKKINGASIKYDYYCKIDISKYFFSISHEVLKENISKFVSNLDLLYAVNIVLQSYITGDLYDNLFAENSYYRLTKNKGLPIGSITSQLFANFYLYNVDYYILKDLKPFLYVRYMDDLIFVDSKDNLNQIKNNTISFLREKNHLEICLKKISINKLKYGISFLGFHIRKNLLGELFIQVSKRNKIKFWKITDKIKSLKQNKFYIEDYKRIKSVFESRKSHFKWTPNYSKYLGIF